MKVSLLAKLLLAQLPLVVAVLLTGFVALQTIGILGAGSQAILKDNYRSVLAAERMEAELDRLLYARLALCLVPNAPAHDRSAEAGFENELTVQEGNITEPGEAEATQALRVSWERFKKSLAQPDQTLAPSGCLTRFRPAAESVRTALAKVLDINQDAMVQKSARAQKLAHERETIMSISLVVALLLAMYASVAFTQKLLRPLGVLSQAARRLGSGDFVARARINAHDEIGALANEFNTMADHLAQYRSSSIGDLLQAQQLTQSAIDGLPDPVLLLKSDGELLSSNEKAEAVLKLPNRIVLGPIYDALESPLAGAVKKAATHVMSGKGPYNPAAYDEAVLVDGADGTVYFLPRANPVYDESGSVTGAAIILQDITKLRRFDDLRNDLVATIAHEFRTPLTSLRMSLYLLIEQKLGVLVEKQLDLLDAARQDTERLYGLVEELLELSRLEHGPLEMHRQPVAPSRLTEDAIARNSRLGSEGQVVVKNEVSPFFPQVSVDPDRVPLILDNLISNAIRHSPKEGLVSVRAAVEGKVIRFSVVDSGPGIPPEYRERIFEKFYRVPGKGGGSAGLGLYIAREVVRNHGGDIGVEAATNKGSTFWFTLPMVS